MRRRKRRYQPQLNAETVKTTKIAGDAPFQAKPRLERKRGVEEALVELTLRLQESEWENRSTDETMSTTSTTSIASPLSSTSSLTLSESDLESDDNGICSERIRSNAEVAMTEMAPKRHKSDSYYEFQSGDSENEEPEKIHSC